MFRLRVNFKPERYPVAETPDTAEKSPRSLPLNSTYEPEWARLSIDEPLTSQLREDTENKLKHRTTTEKIYLAEASNTRGDVIGARQRLIAQRRRQARLINNEPSLSEPIDCEAVREQSSFSSQT